MTFDPNNPIMQLCVRGMELEGRGDRPGAHRLFLQAWEGAGNDLEKFTAAHYLARQQETVADKLKWDETALEFATKIDNSAIRATYPSLYLNIAKCHEDLGHREQALEQYQRALSFSHLLPDDGYGKMILGGIRNGIGRVEGTSQS